MSSNPNILSQMGDTSLWLLCLCAGEWKLLHATQRNGSTKSISSSSMLCCNPERYQRARENLHKLWWDSQILERLKKGVGILTGPISTQFSIRIHWEVGSWSKAYFFILGVSVFCKKKMFADLSFKENLVTGFYWKGLFLPILSEMWWLEENKQQGKLR